MLHISYYLHCLCVCLTAHVHFQCVVSLAADVCVSGSTSVDANVALTVPAESLRKTGSLPDYKNPLMEKRRKRRQTQKL